MSEPTPEALLEQANRHFLDGQYEQALQEFDQVLKMVPPDQHHIVHANRGATLMSVGDVEGAVAAFDEALKVDPNHLEALHNKGVALTELERYSEALECFDKVCSLAPGFYAGQCGKSETLASLGRFEESAKAADAAIAIEPGTVTAYVDKGFALLKLHKFGESCDAYAAAVERGEDSAETKRLYGIVLAQYAMELEEQGEKGRAVEYLAKSCEYSPSAQNFHNQGIILLQLGKVDAAMSKFAKAVEVDDNYFESHAALGILHAQREELAQSCKHLEMACRLNPKSIESLYNLGVIRIKLADLEGARREWLKVLEIEPGEPHATEALRILDAALAEAKKKGSDGKVEAKEAARKISDISAATASASTAAEPKVAAPQHHLEMGPDGKPRGLTEAEVDSLINTLDRLDQQLAVAASEASGAATQTRRKSVLEQKAPPISNQPLPDRSFVRDVSAVQLKKAQPRDKFGGLEAKLTSALTKLADEPDAIERRKSYSFGPRGPGTTLPDRPKIEYSQPGDVTFSYAELKNKFPAGADPARKEEYLTAEEFTKVFGKTKEEFQAYPAWKKIREKKRLGLF